MSRGRGFTSADLEARGFVRGPDGLARRVWREEPRDPLHTFVGVDPGLRNLGLAVVSVWTGCAATRYVGLPGARRRGEGEAEFLSRRLGLLVAAVREWCVGVRSFGRAVHATVEGAKPLPGRKVKLDTLPKLGAAVGACWAAAHLHADGASWVPPDWTWEVLTGRARGGADKALRWRAAEAVLLAAGVAWPLPRPNEIDPLGPQAHEADALALCAARMVRP